MEINKIQRTERKNVTLSLRITKKQSEWLKKENISPQKLVQEALIDLMKK